jgi:hypothetical protein
VYRETPIAALDLRASRRMPVLPEETWFSSACVAVAVEWQTNPVAQLHCPVRPFPQRCSKSEAVQNLPSSGLKAIGMTAGDRTAILLDNNSFHPSSCQPCCESQTAGVVSVARYRQVGRQFIDITHPDGPAPTITTSTRLGSSIIPNLLLIRCCLIERFSEETNCRLGSLLSGGQY